MPVPLDCQAQINFVKTDGFRSGKKLIQLFRDVQLFPRDEATVQIHFRNFIARITQRGDLIIQSPVSEWEWNAKGVH